jgi:hypothetical protein
MRSPPIRAPVQRFVIHRPSGTRRPFNLHRARDRVSILQPTVARVARAGDAFVEKQKAFAFYRFQKAAVDND